MLRTFFSFLSSEFSCLHPSLFCRSNASRPRLLSRPALAALLGLAVCTGAVAQTTAQFSGALSVIPTTGLNQPYGIAVDASGNLFVVDTYNDRVVKLTNSGGNYTQSTFTTATTLNTPRAVAVDAQGNLFIVDTGNQRVLKEVPSVNDGVTTYAETVIANSTTNFLVTPVTVAVDASGDVYIADPNYPVI